MFEKLYHFAAVDYELVQNFVGATFRVAVLILSAGIKPAATKFIFIFTFPLSFKKLFERLPDGQAAILIFARSDWSLRSGRIEKYCYKIIRFHSFVLFFTDYTAN